MKKSSTLVTYYRHIETIYDILAKWYSTDKHSLYNRSLINVSYRNLRHGLFSPDFKASQSAYTNTKQLLKWKNMSSKCK